MKQTAFTWGWSDHPRQPDPSMTRQRMAHLMRCWRRAVRNPAHGTGPINRLELMGRSTSERVYRVTNTPTGEVATFSIRSQS